MANLKHTIQEIYVRVTMYFDLGMAQFQRVLGLLALVTLAGVYRSTLEYYQVPLASFIIVTITLVVLAAIVMGFMYIRLGMFGRTSAISSGLNPEWTDVRDSVREIRRILDGGRTTNEQIISSYNIHPTVFWGYGTLISGGGKIFIDEGTYIGRNSFVTSEPEMATIRIGKNCSIGHNVHIRTQVHIHIFDFEKEKEAKIEGKDIIIGDSVWIGANVYIGGGITIGNNCIIGANSVVTKDIPSNTVWGDNPAVLIRHKEDYINER